MGYTGTRNENLNVTASQAILMGICPDGGLFVPKEIPKVDDLSAFQDLNYQELAYQVLKLYLTDFTEEELRHCINSAYDNKFDTATIASLVKKGEAYFLELFHGRTLAFKDMALSILPYLMKVSAKKNGMDKELVILAATSGDTGKAALEGFADVPDTKVIVFFPEEGVSPVQKLQMTTQEGDNTYVVGIRGNFDDVQSAVKDIFTDDKLREEMAEKGYVFSSANSINIGRLVPQIVYYFYGYFQAVKAGLPLGQVMDVTVPTGNFGNILAGIYAKEMGLPIGKLLCASNDNKVLFDFFQTGEYNKNREFLVTLSPSMDILISSNLERLLYLVAGQQKTKRCMEDLSYKGTYQIDVGRRDISGEFATKEETQQAIYKLYNDAGYVMDTHTAVAYAAFQKFKDAGRCSENAPMMIVSTASPYKFTVDVLASIDEKYQQGDPFLLMEELQRLSGVAIPKPIEGISKRVVRHQDVCERYEIKEIVKHYLFK